MAKPSLTRRKLLSGIVVSGGAGALTGHGVTALFTDEEIFTNNSISASTNTAGVVDIEVDSGSLDGGDGVVFSIELPDEVNNNPSYIWVQPACPEPIDAAEDVRVELRIDCVGNDDPYVINSGELIDVINSLREGVLLRCGDRDGDRCFRPGDQTELVLEVTDSEATGSELAFEFEFYGQQCRYDAGATNPFDPLPECTASQVPGSTPSQVPGISFIAFCSESGDPLDPELAINETNVDGAPTSVDWDTDSDVDYIAVKYDRTFNVYDYPTESTSGTVTAGDDPDAETYEVPSGRGNRRSSTPCELAADVAEDGTVDDEDDFPDDGTSVKLEWDEADEEFKRED